MTNAFTGLGGCADKIGSSTKEKIDQWSTYKVGEVLTSLAEINANDHKNSDCISLLPAGGTGGTPASPPYFGQGYTFQSEWDMFESDWSVLNNANFPKK